MKKLNKIVLSGVLSVFSAGLVLMPTFSLDTESMNKLTADTVSYKTALTEIIQTVNKNDSYILEIRNPENYLEYAEKELNIVLPDHLNKAITRLEFVSLYNDIAYAMSKEKSYETDLIEAEDIFKDIDSLSNEEKNDIENAFAKGLINPDEDNNFYPNRPLTTTAMQLFLEKTDSYSRENLFVYVPSGFTEEERNTALNGAEDSFITYKETVELLKKYDSSFVGKGSNYNKTLTFAELLNLYTDALNEKFICADIDQNKNKTYYFAGKDNSFLSAEEWEYISSNQEKQVLKSEVYTLLDRTDSSLKMLCDVPVIKNSQQAQVLCDYFFPYASNIVEKGNGCIDFFIPALLNQDGNKKSYNDCFLIGLHEAQHEIAAVKSDKNPKRTFTSNGAPCIYKNISSTSKPELYYNSSTGQWLRTSFNLIPKTEEVFPLMSNSAKAVRRFLSYATGPSYQTNIAGLYGILEELASESLETKTEIIMRSMIYNDVTLYYNATYVPIKLLVLEYINSVQEYDINAYNIIMNDTEMIRYINQTMKDLDEYFPVFTALK